MKYICYCDQVTEQDVLDAIGNGARTVRQVCQMTGAMTHCDCKNKMCIRDRWWEEIPPLDRVHS